MSNGKSDYLIRTSIHTHIFHLGLYHKLNHMKKTIFFHLREIHTNMKITKPFNLIKKMAYLRKKEFLICRSTKSSVSKG